jgi:hypothetical protein
MTKKKKPEDLQKVGAKPFYKSAKELEEKIDSYFSDCPDTRITITRDSEGATIPIDVPCPTVTGLALYLGFCDRQSMYDYQEKPEFTCIIKRARTFIEREYEKKLHDTACTGAIFALKNMGWKDKTEQEITGSGVQINFSRDYE